MSDGPAEERALLCEPYHTCSSRSSLPSSVGGTTCASTSVFQLLPRSRAWLWFSGLHSVWSIPKPKSFGRRSSCRHLFHTRTCKPRYWPDLLLIGGAEKLARDRSMIPRRGLSGVARALRPRAQFTDPSRMSMIAALPAPRALRPRSSAERTSLGSSTFSPCAPNACASTA